MKKTRIIITESQYKELISNDNYTILINEGITPINLLDDLISFLTTPTRRRVVLTPELKNAFGLGVRGNLDNLSLKLKGIKDAGDLLSGIQIKNLYSNFYNNKGIRDSFNSFFLNNKDITGLLRAYRKAKLENNTRLLNSTSTELSKFIPDTYVDDLVTKLQSEDYYKLTKNLDFNQLKSTIKSKIKKDGVLDKKTLDDFLETSEVKNLKLDVKEMEELTNLINLKSPETFEFFNLVKTHNPKTDGPFYEYLMENGYITKENYATLLKIYGSKSLVGLENLFKGIGKFYSTKPITRGIATLLAFGLVTAVWRWNDILNILTKLGWYKVSGFVEQNESYIIKSVKEFLNSESPMINNVLIKNLPNNQVEGQEIKVINPVSGLISLDPGIYLKKDGDLETEFIWYDEGKKLTVKKSVNKKETSTTTTPKIPTVVEFEKWYKTQPEFTDLDPKLINLIDIRPNVNNDFEVWFKEDTVENLPEELYLTYTFKDNKFIKK